MTSLAAQKIVLGVTGGIAAYKSADLARRLQDAGASVRVVMTPAAEQFVTKATFQALTHQPVATSVWDATTPHGMPHIELARWADRVLVAPASADFMARLSAGFADDLLSTLCLATRAPIILAPAMNTVMWENAATRINARELTRRGVSLLGPAEGALAERESGAGRMLEPMDIVAALKQAASDESLAGLHVLVTSGPTREPIDPVRFLSNYSSGKMGYAVASACVAAGATVTLVSGPVSLEPPAGVECVPVETAAGMHEAVLARIGTADVFVAAAAVADYTPLAHSGEKIKKQVGDYPLELTRTPDILAEVASRESGPFTVGFAAETRDLEEHARAKLDNKGVDMLAANLVGPEHAFGRDDNALHVFWAGGERRFERAPKVELARSLTQLIGERFNESKQGRDSKQGRGGNG